MTLNPELELIFSRFVSGAAIRQKEAKTYLSTQPQTIPCKVHPDIARPLQPQRTVCDGERWQAKYAPCALCTRQAAEARERERLIAQGVPANLTHATLENWTPGSEQEEAILADVREFARLGKGFLLLLGHVGTGKTHLAIGIQRQHRDGLYRKQSTLLRELRQTYRDQAAGDPIAKAQAASCLVLDEAGVSGGGRDEFPMLNEILDFRHGAGKPTIITSNLGMDALRDVFGERLCDRFRESCFRVLNFTGDSHRKERREDYFNGVG